jgi:hypothetical protein
MQPRAFIYYIYLHLFTIKHSRYHADACAFQAMNNAELPEKSILSKKLLHSSHNGSVWKDWTTVIHMVTFIFNIMLKRKHD